MNILCGLCGEPAEIVKGGPTCYGCNWFIFARNGRRRAAGLVQSAIREGALPRADSLACVDCGTRAREYDHRDYGKPLQVEPVCCKCNVARGPGKPDWHVYQKDKPATIQRYAHFSALKIWVGGPRPFFEARAQ